MEGGHCSNLFELASGNKGAWPARCLFHDTCNKGNAIKIANMGRHASDISQGSDGSSADSQTALRAH